MSGSGTFSRILLITRVYRVHPARRNSYDESPYFNADAPKEKANQEEVTICQCRYKRKKIIRNEGGA